VCEQVETPLAPDATAPAANDTITTASSKPKRNSNGPVKTQSEALAAKYHRPPVDDELPHAALALLTGCTKGRAARGSAPVPDLERVAAEFVPLWYAKRDLDTKVFCYPCARFANHEGFAGSSIERTTLTRHEVQTGHLTCCDKWFAECDAKADGGIAARLTLNDVALEAVRLCMNSAYMIANRAYPFTSYPDYMELHLAAKTPNIPTLYQDRRACAEMIFCMHEHMREEQTKRLNASGTYFSITIDESTDRTKESHLVVCVTSADDLGKVRSEFFDIVRVKNLTGAGLWSSIRDLFKHRGVSLRHKLVGFGSDGASAITSRNCGVVAHVLKEVNAAAVLNHCVAHRTALACKDVATCGGGDAGLAELFGHLDALIIACNAIFAHSGLNRSRFEDLAVLMEVSARLPKTYTQVR
jgi:hypothetical protein